MSKVKIIGSAAAAFLIVLPLGGAAYAIGDNECSYSPSGAFDFGLAKEVVRNWRDPKSGCDPWTAIEPRDHVVAVTIKPYSNWSAEPSRPVRIGQEGDITITEPLNYEGTATAVVARIQNKELSAELLRDLSRFIRFNRLVEGDLEAHLAAQGPDVDVGDIRTFMTPPMIPCRAQMMDGGGASLHAEFSDGTVRETILDSHCHSIAKSVALDSVWDARIRAFAAAEFDGDHYMEPDFDKAP